MIELFDGIVVNAWDVTSIEPDENGKLQVRAGARIFKKQFKTQATAIKISDLIHKRINRERSKM